MPTNRFMCLGCGRFWTLDQRPVRCPYCGDVYYTDNIIADVPPPLYGENERFTLPCGHVFEADMPGDVRFCCGCGTAVQATVGTLRSWQRAELRRLGIC